LRAISISWLVSPIISVRCASTAKFFISQCSISGLGFDFDSSAQRVA
jgi:hypothetical protein